MTSDQLATILQSEGWPIESGDHIVELLKSGQGRKIYAPAQADELINRDITRLENEWAEQKAAEATAIDDAIAKAESKAVDASREGTLERVVVDIKETADSEGYIPEETANEVDDFFVALAEYKAFREERRSAWR